MMHIFVEWTQRSIETWLVQNVANARTDWGSIAVGWEENEISLLVNRMSDGNWTSSRLKHPKPFVYKEIVEAFL